ncbi:ankyrin repeat-containing protein ITN1 isoform X3 [Manihot esculenta]|nr:ankyrin repeat-containing protein ITN1 isoform X3 [Manihot esculenta]XP_043816043.1 ankyrin repeat-containing protein ITN1 isoform X3 [Manihot esculenta]
MDRNTALHEAARKGHFEVVVSLIQKDPDLAMLTNNAGESPLFLAVDKMHFRIASYILETVPGCSFQGRNKMNALHAAVIRSYVHGKEMNTHVKQLRNPLFFVVHLSVRDCVRFIRFGVATLLRRDIQQDHVTDFIKQLIKKHPSTIIEANNIGWTPFHYAAYAGQEAIVKELLLADNSTACTKNGEGMAGLHVAAREGHIPVLKMIAETCPDIWDLKDNNGRTALHVAAESGKAKAVKFILKQVAEDNINDQDNEGNTALHLATLQGHGKIFLLLTNDKRADKTIMNEDFLAVVDIIDSRRAINFFRQGWMIFQLSIAGGLASLEQGRAKKIEARTKPERGIVKNHGDEEVEDKRLKTEGEEVLSFNHLRNMAGTNILVSTLIATVSFAAAFTLPGGYKNDGPDEGLPVFIKKASFRAFVVSNTIAFSCSIASLIFHNFTALLVKRNTIAFWTYFAMVFSSFAICGMFIAFIAGSFAVLGDCTALIMAIFLICCFMFALQFPPLLSIDLLTI